MGIGTWFRGVGRPKNGRQEPLALARWEAAPPRRGSLELIRSYREMPNLRTVVDACTDGVAAVCWRAYRRTKNGRPTKDFGLKFGDFAARSKRLKEFVRAGEVEEVDDHPALHLLGDPSDVLTGRAVTKLLQTYLELPGEAFLAITWRGKVPVGLWPVPAHWVQQLPNRRLPKEDQFYRVSAGGVMMNIPAEDMIHLRQLDPDDPLGRGTGIAYSLGDELDTDEYAARFVKNGFFRGMVPSVVIGMEGAGNPDAAKAFKESLTREHSGPENAGKVLITNGKVSAARLDTSLKDLDFVALRKFLADFVRMAWRVPPEIVGNMASSNKATAYAAREIFAEQVVQPRMEFLRTEYQKRLMPLFDDTTILDYDSPVPEDREFQLRAMVALPMAYSFDEHRAVAGFRPDPQRQGYPAPMPGQDPAEPQQAPSPAEGGAEDTAREDDENAEAAKSDPPWAKSGL